MDWISSGRIELVGFLHACMVYRLLHAMLTTHTASSRGLPKAGSQGQIVPLVFLSALPRTLAGAAHVAAPGHSSSSASIERSHSSPQQLSGFRSRQRRPLYTASAGRSSNVPSSTVSIRLVFHLLLSLLLKCTQ